MQGGFETLLIVVGLCRGDRTDLWVLGLCTCIEGGSLGVG